MNLDPGWIYLSKSTTPDSMEWVSRPEIVDFWGFREAPNFLIMGEGTRIPRGT